MVYSPGGGGITLIVIFFSPFVSLPRLFTYITYFKDNFYTVNAHFIQFIRDRPNKNFSMAYSDILIMGVTNC